MARVEGSGTIEKTDQAFTEDQPLERWKHFASTGVADKNTMVNVTSWLLTFSATIIGYIVTQLFRDNSFTFIQPWKALCLALLGTGISLVAAFVALLYGGYANRNWAKADEIARAHGWGAAGSDNSKEKYEKPNDPSFGLPRFAVGFSKPHDPQHKLPPVFWLFTWLSLSVLVVHLFFLAESLREILWKVITRTN